MRYQRTSERRAVILMVVLSLLTLFALVGITFVLYADAEAAAARIAREAQTSQAADMNPEAALSFFLNQLIYDVPDTVNGVGSGLRGHSLARTMYGLNYVVPPGPSLNFVPFNGVGRLHYGCPSLTYPATALTNVPPNWGAQLDDYAMVNYTWFSGDNFLRDPERYGIRTAAQLTANSQPNPYVGGNAPYTYPDLNNFYLAAVRADGTVLTPSYHRPWLFQVVNGKYYLFNDMTNPNWANSQGKYLTLRPRPFEHPLFPAPGDATGDVKNLSWAAGGNDSIWIDLGAPVQTAPDGTQYKMMFAPLIVDLDGRVNLNTAGNIQAYAAAMAASSNPALATSNSLVWQLASGAHVSNQGWGPWEVNLSKALWGDQILTPYPQSSPPTPPEWMRLFTGMSYVTTMAPNPPTLPFTVQPGVVPPWPMPGNGLSSWLLPGVRGRYLETMVTAPGVTPAVLAGGIPLYPPGGTPGSLQVTPNIVDLTYYNGAPGVNSTYSHVYAQSDFNALNEGTLPNFGATASSRPLLPGSPPVAAWSDPAANPATSLYASFQQGFGNGTAIEGTNHPLLYNVFQSPLATSLTTRTFSAADMEALLRPSASISGAVSANGSAENSDLLRLCPANFPGGAILAGLPANLKTLALRYRNLATTQSWDVGAPGVTPYWWSGMTAGSMVANVTNHMYAPYAAQPAQGLSLGFPPLPPTAASGNVPGTNPIFSEFGNLPVSLLPDWRALSANSYSYFSFNNPQGLGYTTPGSRIRLNRPLPPYPHMGALVTPPYNSQPPGVTATPYGVAYDLTKTPIANQYTAAQSARQAMANDIYRRLLAITGVTPIAAANLTNPLPTDLAPRRWLAQLAVNIVDYIDEDDIMTPFNFYSLQDTNGVALAPTVNPNTKNPPTYPAGTYGPDDNDPLVGNKNTMPTGTNPDFWVFGTELPKVVLNEALAEAQNPSTTQVPVNGESVKVWVELFNTMPTTGGANTQPQDLNRVPLYITLPAGGGYSPYRVTIAQSLMNQNYLTNPPNPLAPPTGLTPELLDVSANVLGKPYVGNANTAGANSPIPQNTADGDFTNPPATANASLKLGNGNPYPNAGVGTNNVGVDPGNFFLIGPSQNLGKYIDPFSANVPATVPVLRTDNMTYSPTAQSWPANPANQDERTSGLTVLLRRLANPYLPAQLDPNLPNYNPYVTVDFLQPIPLRQTQNVNPAPTYQTFGKRQPFAGMIIPNSADSPVCAQIPNLNAPPAGAVVTNDPNGNGSTQSTFGFGNFPLPQSGHYDWLVHLDRAPISPMELLHVSAWPPYMLTQRFVFNNPAAVIQGSDNLATPNPASAPSLTNALNMFGHYAPWLDLPSAGGATALTVAAPWWFDTTAATTMPAGNSHRLYRLFEFLECGDRAFGVNGLGRIPGKVNINTVWDPEILHALIDANTSMGTATAVATPPLAYSPINPATGLPWTPGSPTIAADVVSQIFNNMLLSRSPSYSGLGTYAANPLAIGPVNMGTAADDRPFLPLSTGQYLPSTAGGGLQFPGSYTVGTGVTLDTILRTNNPFVKPATYPIPGAPAPAPNNWLLFQNYADNQTTHPYYQTQLLTKLYNNITTRSNTFAVFLTIGFFQVIPGGVAGHPNIPQLGPEIGRAEGKQIRHRMFAIVDRTNLATFTTTGQAVQPATPPPAYVTGPTPSATNLAAAFNPTGLQTINLPFSAPTPNLTVTGVGVGPTAQLFVFNPTTGVPGVIQAGTQLVIDPGQINEETVTVVSVTPPAGPGLPAAMQANFTLPHGINGLPFTIIQRGNPGPWVLTPYDPRLDSSVVPYFSIVD